MQAWSEALPVSLQVNQLRRSTPSLSSISPHLAMQLMTMVILYPFRTMVTLSGQWWPFTLVPDMPAPAMANFCPSIQKSSVAIKKWSLVLGRGGLSNQNVTTVITKSRALQGGKEMCCSRSVARFVARALMSWTWTHKHHAVHNSSYLRQIQLGQRSCQTWSKFSISDWEILCCMQPLVQLSMRKLLTVAVIASEHLHNLVTTICDIMQSCDRFAAKSQGSMA